MGEKARGVRHAWQQHSATRRDDARNLAPRLRRRYGKTPLAASQELSKIEGCWEETISVASERKDDHHDLASGLAQHAGAE
jgi:hypothetical protein